MKELAMIILISIIVVGVSGCTISDEPQETWGEVKLNLDDIQPLNNTTSDFYEWEGTNYFYVDGYIKNNNPYDAFNLKIKVSLFDKNNSLVGVNDTPYLEPRTIPAKGESYFYIEFEDPNRSIVRYEIEILDAKGRR